MNIKKVFERIPWYWIVFLVMLIALFSSAMSSLVSGVAVVAVLSAGFVLARVGVKRYQSLRSPIVVGAIIYLIWASGRGETFESIVWQLAFAAVFGLLFGGGTASSAADKT